MAILSGQQTTIWIIFFLGINATLYYYDQQGQCLLFVIRLIV